MRTFKKFQLVVIAAIFIFASTTFADDCCTQPDNGSGTVDLPPVGCDYTSPDEVWMIIDGLPPGTTIEGLGTHTNFGNIIRMPGGILGGEMEMFTSTLQLSLHGTGDLLGFQRNINIEIDCEVHTGPRNPGDPVQTFPTDMFRFIGGIYGDPDFDMLTVTAGTDFGLPGPGQTILTELPSGDFAVDSFFDITYQIEFVGAPGSQLDGFAGSTIATIRIRTANDCYNCTAPDNGSGTITFPASCSYYNPDTVIVISSGLPPTSSMVLESSLGNFSGVVSLSGSEEDGKTVFFDAELDLDVNGTGDLAGFNRSISLPVSGELHTGPRNPGEPVQTFVSDLFRLEGEIHGDPDFDLLKITIGTGNGLPSEGKTILTELPSGDFAVDSFFDITYKIEFEGAPGSILEGMAGTTTGTILLFTGYTYETYIAGGYDYLATIEGLMDFNSVEIDSVPSDFFGPGSDPFDGVICLKGEPLGEPDFGEYELADTIVRRREDIPIRSPNEPNNTGLIETEIIALDLKSCRPIEVNYPSLPPEYYNVKVILNPGIPSIGFMYIQGSEAGGTYDMAFSAYLRCIFTEVGGGTPLVYDLPSPVTISATGVNWHNQPQIQTVPPRGGHGQLYCGTPVPGSIIRPKPYGDFFSEPVVLQIGTDGGFMDVTNDDPLPMDLNDDGDVNFSDLAIFANKWLFCP
ncbi:MAG: hypothetical protein JW806_09125 [Sedimentisphaerales bacterium]|nr:hypothetical protein [Sedimentisphaerales bacterium]